MAWSRRTKIGLVVGAAVVFAAVVVGGAWFVLFSERLAGARRTLSEAARLGADLAHVAGTDWSGELQAELDKIEEAGEPLSLQEVVPSEVPEPENAAALYQQAFDSLDLSPADDKTLSHLVDSLRQPPGTDPPPLEAVRQIVAKNAAALELLEQAAQRPRCRFPVDWSAGQDAKCPHHVLLHKCARLLAARLVVQARRGQMGEALSMAQVSLAAAEAVRTEPSLLAQLARYGIQAYTLNAVRAALPQRPAPTEACQGLFDCLQRIEYVQSFLRMLHCERAMGVWCFDQLRQQSAEGAQLGEEGSSEIRRLYSSPGWENVADRDELAYLQLMAEWIPVVAAPYREHPQADAQVEQQAEAVPGCCLMTRVLLPIFTPARARRDRAMARAGLCQVALALKACKNEKGSYPPSLAELRTVIPWKLPEDPFSGEDFLYRPEGEGFLVYSIGENLTDDGGTPHRDSDQGDIVWRCAS